MSLASRNDAKYIETNTQKYYNIVVDKRFESNNKVGGVADISVKYMMRFLIDGGYRKTEQILELRDSIVSKEITEPMKMIILMK